MNEIYLKIECCNCSFKLVNRQSISALLIQFRHVLIKLRRLTENLLHIVGI